MTKRGAEGRQPGDAGRVPELRAPHHTSTRRHLLGSASAGVLVVGLAPLAACAAPPRDPVGEPWDDGTFFDDGTGWVD